jgi:hypothetical protein
MVLLTLLTCSLLEENEQAGEICSSLNELASSFSKVYLGWIKSARAIDCVNWYEFG